MIIELLLEGYLENILGFIFWDYVHPLPVGNYIPRGTNRKIIRVMGTMNRVFMNIPLIDREKSL